MPWVREAWAILVRELTSEWRTRVAAASVGLFAVCSLTLIGLALKGSGITIPPQIAAGLLWVLLLFTAATGLGRAFVREEELGTALALRLSARATTVWAGKFAANAVLLLALSVIATPLLFALLDARVANPALLACVLLLGVVGTAAVFTLTGALVAQSSSQGGLLAALSFPALVPLLLAGVHGTEAALGVGVAAADPWAAARGDVTLLSSYAVVVVTAALILFDLVWDD